MASIEKELYEFLITDQALKGHIGEVYWLDAPIGTQTPYAIFFQVDDPNEKIFLSAYGGQARMQISLFDKNKFNIADNRTRVKEKLRGFCGDKQGVKINNVRIVNDFTQSKGDEQHYQGVIDAIIDWETS